MTFLEHIQTQDNEEAVAKVARNGRIGALANHLINKPVLWSADNGFCIHRFGDSSSTKFYCKHRLVDSVFSRFSRYHSFVTKSVVQMVEAESDYV